MFHWDFFNRKTPWENQVETSNSGTVQPLRLKPRSWTADPTCQGSQARTPGPAAQPLGWKDQGFHLEALLDRCCAWKKGSWFFVGIYREFLFEGFVGDDLWPSYVGIFHGDWNKPSKKEPYDTICKTESKRFFFAWLGCCACFFWWPIETDSSVAGVNEREGFCWVT